MTATLDPRAYSADGILSDGSSIRIRALQPEDRSLLLDHFGRLSARSVYFRFMSAKKHLSETELRTFTELDFVRNAALVATLRSEGEESIIGVGRYNVLEDDEPGAPRRAEVAFAVADEHQGKGVGTLLLEHLVPLARAAGVEEFVADVLGENNRMLRVLADVGLRARRSLRAGVFHVSMVTEETPEFAEARLGRERRAAAESMRTFLNPRSVAVVGASRRAGSIGRALLENVSGHEFTGEVYAVNPNCPDVCGQPSFPSVRAIGRPVDLAVICVPAPHVLEAARDCAAAGVRGVAVVSSGFREVDSAAGGRTEAQLRDLVRGSGMRMLGPNCMGVLNTAPEISLNATFVSMWPPRGGLGVLSQSGSLGVALLDFIRSRHIGISTFVSVGNKADISGNDLLSYWSEDPQTEVIVLYLESFGNPRKFARLAPEVARRKPILAVKSGRSKAGTRAASSHSAALANLDVAVDALFEQAGVIRCDTLEQMMDVATLLSTQPVPAGPRVGVVTNAGGPGILLADACEARGLELPPLDAGTLEQLRELLPSQAGLGNPIDMIAAATPEQYARAVEFVGRDPDIDSVIAIYIPPVVTSPEEITAAIARGAGQVPAHKPVLTVFMASSEVPAALCQGPRGKLPCYVFPENAAMALSSALGYGRWKERARGTVVSLDAYARSAVRAVVDRALEEARGALWLDALDVATVLRAAGIDLAALETCRPEEAPEVSERLGYPLVAKAVAPGLVHKSDCGGVVLGLESASEVREAVESMKRSLATHDLELESVILQREIPGGLEALVGVTGDPTFGPLVVCGLGGVLVELQHDVRFRLTPVSDVDAEDMIERLRTAPLLRGYRGSPPADRAALVSLIQRVSALVEVVPELLELDLNPVKLLAPGKGAIAVDARMRIGPPAR